MTTACPRAPRYEENRRKNNKLILEAKTRRKSDINQRMNIRNVHNSVPNTNVSPVEYTLR